MMIDQTFAKVKLLGFVSRMTTTAGGLTRMNVEVEQRGREAVYTTFVPVKWFRQHGGRFVEEHFKNGDYVDVDATLRMERRKPMKCPHCQADIDFKYYDVNVIGDRIKSAEVGVEPPVEEESDGIPL